MHADYPKLADPTAEIAAGRVLVDGFPRTNPRSLVSPNARISLRDDAPLRGEAKLRAALAEFALDPRDRIAADIGASAGGFTKVLLEHGARRVYAVDAGHGQLLGSLRQNPRCVVLERKNLGDLSDADIPEPVELIAIDVSYVSLASAVPQLEAIEVAPQADLIALVKPMYELGLATPPPESDLEHAVRRATRGVETAPWTMRDVIESPVLGGKGAREFLMWATRRAP